MAIAIIIAITAAAIPIVRADIVARFDAGAAVGAGVEGAFCTTMAVCALDPQ